jgi:hypothetical protein
VLAATEEANKSLHRVRAQFRNANGTVGDGEGFARCGRPGTAMTTAPAPDVETTWKLRLDGQSGIGKLDDPFVEEFDLPVHIGGHLVEEFDGQLTPIELRRRSCLQRMSTVLGRRVWDNAGSPEVDTNRLMVCRAAPGYGAAPLASRVATAIAHATDLRPALDPGASAAPDQAAARAARTALPAKRVALKTRDHYKPVPTVSGDCQGSCGCSS